ncbi:MAG: hypothetical protein AB1696_13865 [Planctomycetota bacterium]
MAISHLTRKTTKRLGELLIDAGLITKEQLDHALAEYKQTGGKLGELLVAKGYVTEHDVAVAIASQFNVPYIDASTYTIDGEIAKLFPVDYMREHNFAPLDKFGTILLIAVASPLSSVAFGQIEKDSGCSLQFLVTSSSSLEQLFIKMKEIQEKEGVAAGAAGVAETAVKPHDISDRAEAEAAALFGGGGGGGGQAKPGAGNEEWSSLLETVADADFLKDLEQSMDQLEFQPGKRDEDEQ